MKDSEGTSCIKYVTCQARNQREGNGAISPPNFLKTYAFVCPPPEIISWLRPCYMS